MSKALYLLCLVLVDLLSSSQRSYVLWHQLVETTKCSFLVYCGFITIRSSGRELYFFFQAFGVFFFVRGGYFQESVVIENGCLNLISKYIFYFFFSEVLCDSFALQI